MKPTNVGTVRLLDAKTRTVELFGPTPLGSRRPTDQELSLQVGRMARPRSVAHCFSASGRRALFIVDSGPTGDLLLDLLGRHPLAPARPASLYGPRGWLVAD